MANLYNTYTILNLLSPDVFSAVKMVKNALAARAPLKKHTAFPDPLAGATRGRKGELK